MKLKNTFLLLGILCTLSSCTVRPDDIRIDQLGGVELNGVTLSQARLVLNFTLANDSRARLTIRDGHLTVSDEKGRIAEVRMDQELVLKKKTSTDISLPLIVRFNGALGSATAIPRLSANPEKLLLNGEVRVRGGSVGKKLKIVNMPLKDFLEMLGASDSAILNL